MAIGRVSRRQARDKRQNYRGDSSQRCSYPEKAGVEGQIERANREPRGIARQDGHQRLRAPYADRSASATEQEAFGQQHAPQRAGACAECRTGRQLALAANRPGKNQVSHVRTGDDEDERRSCEQHQQYGPSPRGDLITKQLGADLVLRFGRIGFRMCFGHGPVDRAQLGASLIEGGTRSETAKDLRHAMDAAGRHGCREMMRTGDDVGDEFGILGIGDGWFEDTDDGGRTIAHKPAVEPDGLAQDGRILPKSGSPETIRENNDASSLRTVVLGSDETTEDMVEAHDIKEGAADDAGLHYARLTQADHGEFGGREIAERAQSFNTGAQILDFRHGKRGVLVASARGALADVDQPVLITADEWLEEHAAHQGEDGGIRADAERQRQDHGDRQPLRPLEGVERNSQIAKKRSEEHTSELQSHSDLVCRLLLEKKNPTTPPPPPPP